jgi:hypothetical protein
LKSLFTDRNGRLVLWQFPNLPLIAWGSAWLVARFSNGDIARVASLIAFGASFTWAWMEAFEGVTPFRRMLGVAVLIFAVATRV